ncbi:MAG: HTH domain-containing protein [Firmicutes bacterium]|nr:HTH domain-containing protein [Bacillota bacterium]
MDKINLNETYIYYKDLFTDKQQMYFEDYYMNDLSLSEIAENYNVSRNAVHNQLKIVEEKIMHYEKVLGLKRKKEEVIDLLSNKIDEEVLDKINEIL